MTRIVFAGLELARRLEAAEGHACKQFATARRQLFPDSGAEWIAYGGGHAVFDGVGSPITQCFGLGLNAELTPSILDAVETFFFDRGASVDVEICPLAGVPALDLLCARGYRPIEISSVMYRNVADPVSEPLEARLISNAEAGVWADISTRAWTHQQPELEVFMRDMCSIMTARENNACFIGEIDGRPGAAGALFVHEGVALFAGAATVPEMRRRGLQRALLDARMLYAYQHGCDLAMMVAEAGSNSQRNAERAGFRVAYTRTKWRLLNSQAAQSAHPSDPPAIRGTP